LLTACEQDQDGIYRVSFKNKFEKLVNLVGFIIRVGENVNLDCAQNLAENNFEEEKTK